MTLRVILGPIVGLIVAVVIVLAVGTLGHTVFPPPSGIDLADPEALAKIFDQLPLGALVFVMVAWIGGAFGGGAIAALIARRPWAAWIIGGVMLAGGLWSMIVIPHPLWMELGLVPATLLPAWFAGQVWGNPGRRGGLPDPRE